MHPSPVSIRLELRVGDDSVCGRATGDGGRQREFVGWLGLLGAIEALTTNDEEEGGDDDHRR